MLWVNFLHLYQPPDSEIFNITEATEKSYLRIVAALENNPRAKFSLNITGCLVESWQELHYFELIARIKKLLERGQIELTGSVAYHCLVPLVPKKEVARQIKENTRILRGAFGEEIKLRGFFMPEMAYSPEAAKIVKNSGFEWLVLDEICHSGNLNEVDFSKVYRAKASGLKIVFRSRKYSSTYVPKLVNKKYPYQELLITATDGELYGLHYRDKNNELEKALANPNVRTQLVSEFIDSRKSFYVTEPVKGNWEASEEELLADNPYALWFDRKNEVHLKLWQFTEMIISLVEKYRRDRNRKWTHYFLSRGLASCTYWWASVKDFSHLFGPIAWNPEAIERGINNLIRAVRSIENRDSRDEKLKAEMECLKVKQLIWRKHWEKYWQ
ncbi:MAG TPA: hypothetical protein VMD74_05105 [Candidatus Methylomirabilis sp.]|nr:hypothetical protein [Candidatus Methylomirabilis sp.]